LKDKKLTKINKLSSVQADLTKKNIENVLFSTEAKTKEYSIPEEHIKFYNL
jgi:hypothetical protein